MIAFTYLDYIHSLMTPIDTTQLVYSLNPLLVLP